MRRIALCVCVCIVALLVFASVAQAADSVKDRLGLHLNTSDGKAYTLVDIYHYYYSVSSTVWKTTYLKAKGRYGNDGPYAFSSVNVDYTLYSDSTVKDTGGGGWVSYGSWAPFSSYYIGLNGYKKSSTHAGTKSTFHASGAWDYVPVKPSHVNGSATWSIGPF